ncbi:CocE/NonD family hydrolase [Chitinophaga solisilvae]|uniref:CocE/NonD family hydrolase n=1 Tax=Chitinophaga solisilvae TaxID=1233460 RepID=UPI0013711B78|nr:CocE/NonD family hydrolase [Chitinophaga solisilvae]
MRRLLLFVFVCVCTPGIAQQFYFPPAYYADNQLLEKHMPLLAGQLADVYKDDNRQEYYDNLFRYQIAAGRFTAAGASIDSLRSLVTGPDTIRRKGIAFAWQTFLDANSLVVSRDWSFTDAYRRAFANLYNGLPSSLTGNVASWMEADLSALKKEQDQSLQQLKGRDVISIAQASRICRAYAAYKVFNRILPPGMTSLAEQDDRHFIIDSVSIKTQDGADISATIVRRKDVTTPLPAILIFNIYTGPVDKTRAKDAAIHGYVGIVANTRGKNRSQQAIEPFEHDGADIYEVIDWISKQSWNNGKVGMYGGSYLGFAQWSATKRLHPALKTIVPQVAVGIGVDYPLFNNVFMSYMLQWLHMVTNSRQTDNAEFNNFPHWEATNMKWYASGKAFRALDTIEGRPHAIFQRWLQHPGQDAYWQHMVPYKEDFSRINIPILTTTGYYDDDQLGAMYYYQQHHQYNKKAEHYLLIGPYDHPGAQSIAAGKLPNYEIDPAARINILDLTYAWFDYIMKDSSKPALLKDKVNYEVMGANEWRHAPSLREINNDTLTLYLSNTRSSQHYLLSAARPSTGEFIRQEVDLADRSDTTNRYDYSNVVDNVINVKDALSFVSKPFEQPVVITGSWFGELDAVINKKDMDISISLYERTADGKYFKLNDYVGRASYAKDRSRRTLLQPGRQERIPVRNTFFTSKKISKGSQLVAVVGINKSPRWQINYGTGKDVSTEDIRDAGVPLQIKWFSSSYMKIPVRK